jgi:hypothetical protein
LSRPIKSTAGFNYRSRFFVRKISAIRFFCPGDREEFVKKIPVPGATGGIGMDREVTV